MIYVVLKNGKITKQKMIFHNMSFVVIAIAVV